MCTVSWWRKDDCFGILFNRDESRQRLTAIPPERFPKTVPVYLSPVDRDAGGTWLWGNRYGLIGCVLNNYPGQDISPDNLVSRGLLLKSLACHKTLPAIENALGKEMLENYRPFFLFLLSSEDSVLFSWNGADLQRMDGTALCCPLSTSGYRPQEVIDYRRDQFEKLVGGGPDHSFENLLAFHNQHDPKFPAHSVIMSRADACTVSQSRVAVESEMISFSYATISGDGSPQPATITRLSRE